MKLFLLILLTLTLNSCFKTDLDGAILPIDNDAQDFSNDGTLTFIKTYNLQVATGYFGKENENLVTPDSSNGIKLPDYLCPKKVRIEVISGGIGAGYVELYTNASATAQMIYFNSNSYDVSNYINQGDYFHFYYNYAISGQIKMHLTVEVCD